MGDPIAELLLYPRNFAKRPRLALGDAVDLKVAGRDRRDRWILEPAS